MENNKFDLEPKDYILINDVAKLMRVSSETIRFYERKNIVTPHRGNDNRYRYFTQADIRKLYDCKIYQGLGFSITEIIELFQTSSAEKLEEMLEIKENELEKLIEQNTQTLSRIRQIQKANEKLVHYSGNYYIQDSNHCLASFHSDQEILDRNAIEHPFWDYVAQDYNDFVCTAWIPLEAARKKDTNRKMKNGYSIPYEKALKLGLKPGGPVVELKPQKSVYTVFHAEPVVDCVHLIPVLDWIEKSNLKVCGDVICNTPKITFDHGQDSRIYEVWIPIE